MPMTVDVAVTLRRLSPAAQQCFFGYYDVPAADAAGRHLCHRVAFRDRLPGPEDVAELGWIPLPRDAGQPAGDLPFTPFAATTAWNFQQGAMLQWLPACPDTCIYNVRDGERFASCLHNLRTGERRRLPLPVMNVSADGRWALCGNMSRQFDFRPGYGYAGVPDPFAAVNAPADDGVFVMDLATGEHRLVLSLAAIVAFLARSGAAIGDWKVMINCMTFNPSATRFILFLRSFPVPGERRPTPWRTFIPTARRDGAELRHHPVWEVASHYHWRDDAVMAIWTKAREGDRQDLLLLDDRTGERQVIDRVFFLKDGHCSFSPDRRWLLYDSYPQSGPPDHLRNLQVYDLDRHRGVTLGRFRSDPPGFDTDRRCDLHPRWMPDGRHLSFDSIHEGFRALYWADLGGIAG